MKFMIFLVFASLLVAEQAAQTTCGKGCVASGSNSHSFCENLCSSCNGHVHCLNNVDECVCHTDHTHQP